MRFYQPSVLLLSFFLIEWLVLINVAGRVGKKYIIKISMSMTIVAVMLKAVCVVGLSIDITYIYSPMYLLE